MTQDNLSFHKIESVYIFNFFFFFPVSRFSPSSVSWPGKTWSPFPGIHLPRSFVVASLAIFLLVEFLYFSRILDEQMHIKTVKMSYFSNHMDLLLPGSTVCSCFFLYEQILFRKDTEVLEHALFIYISDTVPLSLKILSL